MKSENFTDCDANVPKKNTEKEQLHSIFKQQTV